MKYFGFYLLLYLALSIPASHSQSTDDLKYVTFLSAEKIEQADMKLVWLTENWRYHPGDDSTWANPFYDDSNWEPIHPSLNLKRTYPKGGWNGNGWFRLHLKIDSTLYNKPLGMRLRHYGASEVYLDGKLLCKLGTVGTNRQEENRFYPQYPRTVIFTGGENHVIAVRYSNHARSRYMQKILGMGFSMNIGHMDDAIAVKLLWSVRYKTYMLIIVVASLLLGLFHIILFSYNPKQKLNLYLTLLSIAFAASAYFSFQIHYTSDPVIFVLFLQLATLTTVVLVILQLLTVYKLFYPKLPKLFYLFAGYALVVLFLLFYPSSKVLISGNWLLILGFAESARVGVMKGLRRKGEYGIIVAGLVILFISIVYQMLINYRIISPIGDLFMAYIYGFLAFLISISVFLAMQFARTSRDLEQQLVQVSKLSEKNLEQERIAKEQEIAHRLLEADNKRITEELEEARELQLSMLPKTVPKIANLDIAAFMKTATEVGGDYYDFSIGNDGTLTIVLGDATGHGMKAGLMVSLVKSLFLADAADMDVVSFLKVCGKTIKKMQLGNLYMAMTLLKIRDNRITTSVAGMPPILIYRHQENRAEEVTIKGMPLGGPEGSTYQEINREIKSGDTILLMSDGFPELFNDEMEMLDYSRVKEIFEEIAPKSPKEIITHLREAAEDWLNGKPQDDDITFVVLKYK